MPCAPTSSRQPWMALISLRFFWTSRRLWPWPTTIRKEGRRCAPYTTLRGSAQAAKPAFPALQVKHPEHAEPDQTDEDQIDRHDEIEQPRHQQDQDTRDQGDDGGNMRSGDGHSNASGRSSGKSNRGRQLTRWRGSGIGDACGADGFRPRKKLPV